MSEIAVAWFAAEIEPTYTVQDCVLDFIAQRFRDYPFDESLESALNLNYRLYWADVPRQQYRFADSDREYTFRWLGKPFRAVRIANRCSIWRDYPKKGRA